MTFVTITLTWYECQVSVRILQVPQERLEGSGGVDKVCLNSSETNIILFGCTDLIRFFPSKIHIVVQIFREKDGVKIDSEVSDSCSIFDVLVGTFPVPGRDREVVINYRRDCDTLFISFFQDLSPLT